MGQILFPSSRALSVGVFALLLALSFGEKRGMGAEESPTEEETLENEGNESGEESVLQSFFTTEAAQNAYRKRRIHSRSIPGCQNQNPSAPQVVDPVQRIWVGEKVQEIAASATLPGEEGFKLSPVRISPTGLVETDCTQGSVRFVNHKTRDCVFPFNNIHPQFLAIFSRDLYACAKRYFDPSLPPEERYIELGVDEQASRSVRSVTGSPGEKSMHTYGTGLDFEYFTAGKFTFNYQQATANGRRSHQWQYVGIPLRECMNQQHAGWLGKKPFYDFVDRFHGTTKSKHRDHWHIEPTWEAMLLLDLFKNPIESITDPARIATREFILSRLYPKKYPQKRIQFTGKRLKRR